MDRWAIPDFMALNLFAIVAAGLFAQGGGVDIVYLLKIIVIVAAVVAIVYVALTYFGMTIPPVAVKIFWIVVVAALALIGITFLMRLL